MTWGLMAALLICMTFCTLWGARYDESKDTFLSLSDVSFLRGFWCIVVVLVHIPTLYVNKVQDMVGSFAYIGVTFFFMTSAYGLKYSVASKKGYLDRFWRNRLPKLLVPALLANALQVSASGALNGWNTISIVSYLNINNWVKVLLCEYFVFWLVYAVLPRWIRGGYWQDATICGFVLTCSLIDHFTPYKITWSWEVEPFGFIYGLIVANHSEEVRSFLNKQWMKKCVVFLILACTLGIVYLRYKPIPFWGNYLLKLILGFSITLFVFEVIAKLKVGNRVNGFLGSISYEVFLIHGATFRILMLFDRNGDMNSGEFILLSIILTIMLATLLKKISGYLAKEVKKHI